MHNVILIFVQENIKYNYFLFFFWFLLADGDVKTVVFKDSYFEILSPIGI